jgi:hypothetical protein|tara:strand:+ start:455 stop:832 length:378 start_codon:yes stop_codon:yes gene_type:complete
MKSKTYWTTEHYLDAVPIDLGELIRAVTAQSNRDLWCNNHLTPETCPLDPDFLITEESLLEKTRHYTQTGNKLDAYRIYDGDYGGDKFYLTVGIRYGDEGSEYISPQLTREVADLFDLDPLKKDK